MGGGASRASKKSTAPPGAARGGYHVGTDESSTQAIPPVKKENEGLTDLSDFKRDFSGGYKAAKKPEKKQADVAGDLLKGYSK